MFIDRVIVRLVKIPLRQGFRTSFGALIEKTAVIVELRTSEGICGFGEASAISSATYSEESVYSVFQCSQHDLAPRVLGQEIATPEQLLALLAPIRGNPFAK